MPLQIALALPLLALGCSIEWVWLGDRPDLGLTAPADQAPTDMALWTSCGAGLQPHSPWPMRGRCQNHQSRSPYVGAQSATKKWEFQTLGPVRRGASIAADGTIYVGSNDGILYALRPDGTKKWQFMTGGSVNATPAIGADGTIYIGSDSGTLFAIAPDGIQKWQFIAGDAVDASPAIGSDGTIYIGSYNKKFYAIHPNGTQKWVIPTSGRPTSAAIGEDGTIYYVDIAQPETRLKTILPNGTTTWMKPGGTEDSAPTLGDDGKIYIGSLLNGLIAVHASSGAMEWSYPAGPASSSIAIGMGTVWVGVGNTIHALKSDDGTHQWMFTAGGGLFASQPAVGADGTLYVGSQDKNVYAIAANGALKWSFATGDQILSSPAIGSDGTIYIGSDDHKVYAIGP